MEAIELSEEEEKYLFRALEYFKKAEEIEIKELMSFGGNRDYVPECEQRLQIFKSLISKCQNSDNFGKLSKDENYLFYRALDYYQRAAQREIDDLLLPGGNKMYLPECTAQLHIFESLIKKFRLAV